MMRNLWKTIQMFLWRFWHWTCQSIFQLERNDTVNMEADSPPVETDLSIVVIDDTTSNNETTAADKSLEESSEEIEADIIDSFNTSNITVIEKTKEIEPEIAKKVPQCEGSDSGVEVVENVEPLFQRNLSSNSGTSQDFDNLNCVQSCDSSIISYCSNYDEAYNLLVRKNSNLLENYRRHEDVTSENGSESSSISGSNLRTNRRTSASNAKKKVSTPDAKTKPSTKDRSRSKPPVNPKIPNGSVRLKSIDRLQSKPTQSTKSNCLRTKTAPTNLDLLKKETKRPSPATTRTPSNSRTPSTTPTDDGRWPSINSKPAPLMSRSLKGQIDSPKQKISQTDAKTIEKYATLPRQKKDKSSENVKEAKKSSSRENTVHRMALSKKSSKDNTPSKMTSSLFLPKIKQRTKIYHECCIQTALTMTDVENALLGVMINPKSPKDSEKCDKGVQADLMTREMEKLEETLKQLNEKYESLQNEHKLQTEKLKETEIKLREETIQKEGLQEELQNNSQRVLAILGGDVELNSDAESKSSDSLLVLETRFQNVGQVVIKQEHEISKLNTLCRALQTELERSVASQTILLQQYKDLESESVELQEFMQAEKMTLHDALKESEAELQRQQLMNEQKDKDSAEKQDEYRHLVRANEQRRQENLNLKTTLALLESKSRELLVHQGSTVSGATVALSSLIGRLEGLVEELVAAYTISDQELEDVIFHNEAYKNSSSSPESTPEKSRKLFVDKSPTPPKGSSFVSAVINAIKSAAQSPFAMRDVSKDTLSTDHSSSNEMLDSETEPILMMEPVLENVVIPDGHSQNLVSSGHGSMMSSRLTHSESLTDLSHAVYNRQISEPSLSLYGSLNASVTGDLASVSEMFSSVSLVDQVIEVDNLITRLLKVIRIIQLETEDCMNELQEHKDNLSEQVQKQKETNKVVVTQLKDWEALGARLKTEVKDLMAQLSKKNAEMDSLKTELNKQREVLEKLNQDVCELSTALSKAELDIKMKEEDVVEEMKKWEKTGELPTPDILGRLVSANNEIPILKEKLAEKEKHLQELTQEFLTSRQVLSESLKDALSESKKQYDAIDSALEVLHSIQPVVQQCAPLGKLQRDLEEISFQSASSMPLVPSDCNANAALMQAVASLEITPAINSTA